MAFTNSSLVSLTRISPNRNSPRNKPITKITIHHMAGVNSIETFASIVAAPSRQMSSNYGIGNDGRIVLTCPESDRSWCSSSPWNDHRAITIEVSNSAYGDASGWPIGDKAYVLHNQPDCHSFGAGSPCSLSGILYHRDGSQV